MLNKRSQRHALHGYHSEEIKIINLFIRLAFEPTTCHVSHGCVATSRLSTFLYPHKKVISILKKNNKIKFVVKPKAQSEINSFEDNITPLYY